MMDELMGSIRIPRWDHFHCRCIARHNFYQCEAARHLFCCGSLVCGLTVRWPWLGRPGLDDAARLIPQLSIFMSAGFYLTFSALLFIVWALAFFLFDRLTFWLIRPGQMT